MVKKGRKGWNVSMLLKKLSRNAISKSVNKIYRESKKSTYAQRVKNECSEIKKLYEDNKFDSDSLLKRLDELEFELGIQNGLFINMIWGIITGLIVAGFTSVSFTSEINSLFKSLQKIWNASTESIYIIAEIVVLFAIVFGLIFVLPLILFLLIGLKGSKILYRDKDRYCIVFEKDIIVKVLKDNHHIYVNDPANSPQSFNILKFDVSNHIPYQSRKHSKQRGKAKERYSFSRCPSKRA